jgi:CheY-like chemotaxis protein
MIVEDEVFIAFLLGEVLKSMGHEVCATERTQRGAIAAALACKPDLMIVDERLEEGSGLAVVEAVLRNGPTPHIFVSGDTSRIRRLMPDAVVLEKPYQESDLAQAIQRALVLGRAGPGPRGCGSRIYGSQYRGRRVATCNRSRRFPGFGVSVVSGG